MDFGGCPLRHWDRMTPIPNDWGDFPKSFWYRYISHQNDMKGNPQRIGGAILDEGYEHI